MKITKKILLFLLVLIVMIPYVTINASAKSTGNNGNQSDPIGETPASYPLHQADQAPIDWLSYRQGETFDLSEKKGETDFVKGYTADGVGIFWHFINPDKLGGYANINFVDENGKIVEFKNVQSYKSNQHFGVVTDYGWKLLSAEYFPQEAPKKGATQFNLSHTAGKLPVVQPAVGSLNVNVDVTKQHEKITYQPVWQKKYQPVWQKEYQPYYAPVYAKDVSTDNTDTLVSLSSNAFKNGHTYVPVNVAAASADGGSWFDIADSSPQNRPNGYKYNVKIANGKLTISFDDRLIAANVGAYVVNNPKDFPGNAPAHFGNSVSVDMPAGYGDVVYLYFHNAGGLKWYTTGKYEFKEYRWVRTDLVADYKVRDDLVADEFVRNDKVGNEFVKDKYDVKFTLVVTDENGNEVYNGGINNGDEFSLDNLKPGKYTSVLRGDDFDDVTKSVTVVAGEKASANFDNIVVTDKDYVEEEYLEKIYLDVIYLDKIYLKDIYLKDIYLDDEYAIYLN
ncbi:hypothetical protein [Lysinibacillus sp. BPa_S21]|uniref:hypothetical protein n=1 Tax=Lysinibacillus sp. BPa_S21 TaxID=2932478 RepID=UPI0020130DB4|nr:hypothetical protein [Lysinibacillus sp. BPa_S21]MCL1697014.1 hypothetical protein [Lysinibacillus sp. BPa_S21]